MRPSRVHTWARAWRTGHFREDGARVVPPERVLHIQVVLFPLDAVAVRHLPPNQRPRTAPRQVSKDAVHFSPPTAPCAADLERDAVQAQVQDVVHERLVRPRVVEGRRHVHGPVEQDEHWVAHQYRRAANST